MTIKERLLALRKEMKKQGITWYLMITTDPHASEYINDYYKEREFFSGFTGSNGTLLVGESKAYLWTDGRYFVQAEIELKDSNIELMRMGEKNVPTVIEYLKEHLTQKDTLSMNYELVSASYGNELEELCNENKAGFIETTDMVNRIWKERPYDSEEPIRILDENLTGKSMDEKLSEIRKQMKEAHADYLIISKLDDQMWLFNIRGNDIQCNPVAYAYTIIGMNQIILFVKQKAMTETLLHYAKTHSFEIKNYTEFTSSLICIVKDSNVWIDLKESNYQTVRTLKSAAKVIDGQSPTTLAKAIKNETEIKNLKEIYRVDSVALTRFLMWMEQEGIPNEISEVEAADYLDQLRKNIPQFFELSFPTISAFGANAAMMHYEATKENHTRIKGNGIYLVDSGGQYDGGTTDVTRSIVCGTIDDSIKKHFTMTVVGMLHLQNAVFMKGVAGRNLDILAREPLWRLLIDYKCGTGHGIGYMLNVHEGPQNISWHNRMNGKETIMEAGMIISDEPGVYVAGSHGIRIENILLCVPIGTSKDGEFLGFEPLTMVPIDRKAIDKSLMTIEDIDALNNYHKLVYEKISVSLKEEEKKWLREATKPI